ncbi:NAD(P)-binding domain-containing protein [Hymenobacter sp.]|uniref:NADPH-dependent F420 reductase n=1 Tax=Hymenobacter sp. TaxID=1898978 RepID=UPI00286D3E0F|nr:NAD(P)-binding domain-containing protein [Hymenobacter sp.]
MKIGIVGSGNMGRTLGLRWAEKGHQVFFGARNQRDLNFLVEVAGADLPRGTLREAIAFGDVLLYTLRDTLPSAVADPEEWQHKILIDCNNGEIPEDFDYAPVLQSYTEKYQNDVPGVKVVKAFNTTAQEAYSHPAEVLRQSRAVCFLAGDDETAKQLVSELINDVGLTPLDAGQAFNARLLESYGDLVRLLMIKNGLGPFLTFSAQVLPAIESRKLGERQPSNYK